MGGEVGKREIQVISTFLYFQSRVRSAALGCLFIMEWWKVGIRMAVRKIAPLAKKYSENGCSLKQENISKMCRHAFDTIMNIISYIIRDFDQTVKNEFSQWTKCILRQINNLSVPKKQTLLRLDSYDYDRLSNF